MGHFSSSCFWNITSSSLSLWPTQWAAHGLDLVTLTAKDDQAGNPEYLNAPCPDEAFYNRYRSSIYEFIRSGEVAAWKPRSKLPGGSYVTNFLDADGQSSPKVDFRADKCMFWKSNGLGGGEFHWSD